MRAPLHEIYVGDVISVLRTFPERSVQCCVTSPPYWGLRSYLPSDHPDKAREIGTEKTPGEYVEKLVGVFREVRRVLRDDGTLWLNLGDCYARQGGVGAPGKTAIVGNTREGIQERNCEPPPGMKPKDLVGIPWSVAFALRQDGWWLRSDVIWAKGTSHQKAMRETAAAAMLEEGVAPEVVDRVLTRWEPYVGNCMPSSVEDRPTSSHEYVFLLTKSASYFYDAVAVREEAPARSGAAGTFKRTGSKREQVIPGQTMGTHRPDRDDRVPAGRNMRSVFTIPTTSFPGAHFATFPERLITPLVRAGSSERGCCPTCGAPHERVVERGAPDEEQKKACGADSTGGYDGVSTKDHDAHGVQDASAVKARILDGMRARVTTGWAKSCACATDDVQPNLILDPFSGSGTTGVVATREGRDFVGIELSAENAEMSRQRISDPDYARKVRAARRAEKVKQ